MPAEKDKTSGAPCDLSRWIAILISIFLFSTPAGGATEISFRNDVMAVLSKGGCNAGACHGNLNGKGGLKLSLRGEDAAWDHRALTSDLLSRRIDVFQPANSLILLKPTTEVPHEGRLRFSKDSPEYKILYGWIQGRAQDDGSSAPRITELKVEPLECILVTPSNQVQLTVRALFSDGKEKAVNHLAVYEPSDPTVEAGHDGLIKLAKPGETTVIVRFLEKQVPVRIALIGNRPGFRWAGPTPVNSIDEAVFAKLRKLRMNPSDQCSDSDFIRRAYLDLAGTIPTSDEAKRFVRDTTPEKRSKLVDRLLERHEFAEFWGLKWADLLRNEEKSLDHKGVQSFHRWIVQSLATNKPLDQFVQELITARGSSYRNPAANYYRALRDPVTRAESTAQLFLGTRLQCAKCHNHPFDRWTQADYYDWANVFSRVQYKVIENNRRDRLDSHEFNGEQIVWVADGGSVTNPKTEKAAKSRFLGESTPGNFRKEEELDALARWITKHPLFARSMVNRIWYHLMGRGLVDPIDDFRPTNPASHPELLEELAADFVRSGFDLREMIRQIASSQVYQLSSEPNETNRDDEINYSRAIIRRLSAEQLLDAESRVMGVSLRFNGYPAGVRAGQIPGVRAVRARDQKPAMGDQMLELFGKPQRLLTCECERATETSMGQAFNLISGPSIHDLLSQSENRLSVLLKTTDEEAVTELFWSALSRAPSSAEKKASVDTLRMAKNRRAAMEDLAWALLNAKEFLLRR